MTEKIEADIIRMYFYEHKSIPEIREYFFACSFNGNSPNYEQIRNVVRKHKRKLNKELHTEPLKEQPNNQTVEINKDGTITSDKFIKSTEKGIHDKNKILQSHGYEPDDWILLTAKNSVWDAQVKGGSIEQLYSSKITVKPRSVVTTDVMFSAYKKMCDGVQMPHVSLIHKKPSDFMLETTFCDLHLNKLCWNGNTNNDFDFKIAKERFSFIVNDLLEEVKDRSFERIIFPVGNDFFNCDNKAGTTEKGTMQDNDERFQKMYTEGILMLEWAIEQLKLKGKVDVILIQGNHDETLSMTAAINLETAFRNDDNVTVDSRPIKRKYLQFGKCMLGLGHLSEEKKKDIEPIMASEAPDIWGNTIYREFHGSHKHILEMSQGKGSVVRRNPSVTGTDAWHYDSGYTTAFKTNLSYIWHKEQGIKNTIHTNIFN